MNILGVGVPEIAIVVLIILVVAGPERAIRWAYLIGREMGRIRAMGEEAMAAFRAEIEAAGLDKDLDELKKAGRDLQKIASETPDPRRQIGQAIKEVKGVSFNGGKKDGAAEEKKAKPASTDAQPTPEAQPFKSEAPQPAEPEAQAAEPEPETQAVEPEPEAQAAEPAEAEAAEPPPQAVAQPETAAEVEAAEPAQPAESPDPPDDGQPSTENT
jgi:sec-independent protein translocase protein TatB